MNLQFFFFILIIDDYRHLRHVLGHRSRHHRNQGNGASKNHAREIYDIDNDTWMKNSPRYESIDGIETDDLKKGRYSIVNENQQKSNALFPSLIDVAPSATITANATCGTSNIGSDETYCKLGNALQCGVCNDIISDKRHPISYATDNDFSNWWQSPTLEQGSEYEHVSITMDLKQEYYVWYVIVKCAISSRPANWILERSIDGSQFSVWQYFFASEEDCWQYGLPTTNTAAKVTSATDNETLCSTYYSKLQPLENGEIHAFIAKSRTGCVSNCSIIGTDELKEFSRARFIRFRFQKLNFPKDKFASLADPQFRRRLFYSVKKISVGAQCICHGHASRCKRSQDLYPLCECKHHTCGNNCEYCCPLYNQKPWMEATLFGSSVCEQCQCHGHATACQYDAHVAVNNRSINIRGEYIGGGVCINCTKHTSGINCEKCETGWYRPIEVLPNAEEPCLPCDCFVPGSVGHCVADDSNFEVDGKKPGTCTCLENFVGLKCDRCATGYYNFPNCEKCECDYRGTLQAQSCEDECVCKEKVEGKMCNQCKKGYFGLSVNNPAGCTDCYCSGLSSICDEAVGYRLYSIYNLTDWMITDTYVTKFFSPNWDSEKKLYFIYDSEMQPDVSQYYWLAPEQYLGNKLTSYGLALRLTVEWLVQRGDTYGKPIFNPDIIIVGKNGLTIAHGNNNYAGFDKMMLSVRLSDEDWYHLDDEWKTSNYAYSPLNDKRRVSRREMLSVLADIKHILLRAKFHADQIECSLVDVELERGSRDTNDERPIVSTIEKCQCPKGYIGLSCEQCDYGYVYLQPNSSTDHFSCSPCNCNGHSPSCNLSTGQCYVCEHNTTGSRCEQCLDGFYGNAQVGNTDDCKVCACPLLEASNNFSPMCVLKYPSADEYICTQCPKGYAGDHCEICNEGYFGNPLKIGSMCKSCDCGGNPCNRTTGQCLQCEGNTEGWYCEKCKDGFYGIAAEKNCTRCDCNIVGSENSTSCDIHSGQCMCKMNYIGKKCDKCLDGFGNFESGCTPCRCNILGSENEICDSNTGQCPCKRAVVGKFCDRCVQNYYGFEGGQGCTSCSCDEVGSLDGDCDDITGQCSCKNNVAGRTCNHCLDSYWGLNENGCSPCECDTIGSLSQICNFISGQCPCKFGITGRKCDRCQKNFYGFSKFGCFECEKCKKPGHICDSHTGRCVCPYLTEGPSCNKCVAGAWNYQTTHGCQECKCDKHGSKSNFCNYETGQCYCRTGYSGEKCNLCAAGYYGFPKCRPCSCNLAGSDPETCFDNHCLCDNSGNCYCKANTVGRRCDQCKEGTFGLHSDNFGGCTACFCFGRSTQCTEAGLTWSHVKLRPDRTLTVHYDMSNNTNISSTDIYPVNTQEICFINLAPPGLKSGDGTQVAESSENGVKLNVINNLRLIPGFTGDVEIGVNYLFDAPVYWQLPSQFLGDKVLSYGGFIEFMVDTAGEHTSLPPAVISSYPLIQMQGNGRFIVEYFPPLISADKHYRVRLHESLWKLKNNPTGHVSRDVFMLTLQNLQHILIRASRSIDFTKATLSGVIWDFAVRHEDILPPTTSLTHGIELCECPSQYSSYSCQNPGIGYYRYFDNRTTPVSTIIIDVIGEVTKCDCNGLSTVCDINTGICQNCSKNTGGAHCEKCAEGYYRSEVNGECKSCSCPSTISNHASTCHVTKKPEGSETTCFCKTGFKGKTCDRCDYGWYGYPRLPNGSCQPCNCDPYGSISDECHEETGQCNCKSDSTGRDCSLCVKKKHVLTTKGCSLCTDGCVQMLLNSVDEMSANLTEDSYALINVKLKPPWHLLANTNENVTRIEDILKAYDLSSQHLLSRGFAAEEELKKRVKNSINKIKRIGKQIQNLNLSINLLAKNASILTNLSSYISDDIRTIVENLQKYIDSKKVNLNLPAVMSEARFLWNNIKNLENNDRLERVEKISSYCRITFDNAQNYENYGPGLHLLKKRIGKLNERIDDLSAITSNITSEISQIKHYSGLNKDKLRWISNISNSVNDILLDVRKLQEPLSLQDDALEQLIDGTNGNLQNLRYNLNNMKNLTKLVEKKEGILFDLNSRYLETYVNPAQKHADMLLQLARHYVSLFSATKHDADIAMRASKAYKNIIDALFDAQQALNDANNVINILSDRLRSKPGQNSVVDVAHSMEEISRQLKTQASIELLNVDSLQKQYDYRLLIVSSSEKQLMDIIQNVSLILRQLTGMDRSDDHIKNINNVVKKYSNISGILDTLFDSIFEVQDKIHDELKPKLNKLQGYGDMGLHPADEFKIKEAEEATYNMVAQLQSTQSRFFERSKYFEKWNGSISDQLDDLRNKIDETRHLANSIHLSLSSKNDQELCTRSYQSKFLKPSITNYISMTYAISSSHRDALLFYLAGSSSGDFLAVEMINRKIRFVWDLGGGPAEVTHHLHIQTAGDLQKDQHWYKIDAERLGNVGKLSVRPVIVPPGSILTLSKPVTNTSTPGWNRFDVASTDYIWIGGANKPSNSVLLSKQNGLIGCLYTVFFDNRQIGLWNFKAESLTGCGACVEGAEEVRDDDSYFFTGDGYSSLPGHSSTVYNKYFFSVAFNFKTFDENAILFYAVTAKNEQFISVMLKDGRILFQIGYTDEIKLEIRSSYRYATGNWTRVEAARYYDRKKKTEKGVLKVGGEIKEGLPEPMIPRQSDIPDLTMPHYFFGGVPPGFEAYFALPQSFLGCMSDLQVLQEAYNPVKGAFWGVQRTCSDKPITVVGFKGNGYIELQSYPLKKSSSFSFVFSTKQPNSFLMLSTTEGLGSSVNDGEPSEDETNMGKTDEINYYSVSLHEGRIELIVNAGNGETRLQSRVDTNYNDGQLHSLTLIKTGKRLELRVDDEIQAIGFMEEEGSGTVQAAGTVGGLFFGGFPSDLILNVSLVSHIPLIGTIKDAIFNDHLIHFDKLIEFEEALIGRMGPQTTFSDWDVQAQNTEAGTTNSCHKPRPYSVEPSAVQFDEQPLSYVRLDYLRQAFHGKNSTIELSFRTFYTEGILLVIPTHDEKPVHFLKVFLQSNRINVQIKNKRIQHELSYNDGNWHRIKITREGKTLSLVADDSPMRKKEMVPKKITWKNVIYFGGYSNELSLFASNTNPHTESLKGCIKDVTVNNKKEDLVGERAIHHKVDQCFPKIEKGAHFMGDGYSVVANNHHIGRSLNFELEFRTSELNGVLMSISEPQGYPALSLELNKGKIILNGDMGDRRPFKIEQEFSSEFYLCDNEWHHVKIVFLEEEITLYVDDQNKMYWLSDNGHITEAETNSAFYIGGLPETAAIGTLENKEGFKGCMRNVMINGQALEWSQFSELRRVFTSSCPVQ